MLTELSPGPGLIMDIFIIAIVVFSMILGARRGLARTMASFIQWFGCIILGFLLSGKVKDTLMTSTGLDDALNQCIFNRIEDSITDSSPYQAIPDLFSGWIGDITDDFTYGASASITSVLMTVIAFLLVVFGVKLVVALLIRLFSRKYHRGVIGFMDGLGGLLFGGVRGIIYVLLLFALLIPVLGVIWPGVSEWVSQAIDQGQLANLLYNNNVLLILVRDLFS